MFMIFYVKDHHRIECNVVRVHPPSIANDGYIFGGGSFFLYMVGAVVTDQLGFNDFASRNKRKPGTQCNRWPFSSVISISLTYYYYCVYFVLLLFFFVGNSLCHHKHLLHSYNSRRENNSLNVCGKSFALKMIRAFVWQ